MKPDIDTTKPIQVACAGRGGNAIGLWFDFVLIHMTDKHAYGHMADTNEQMSEPWRFTEWKFRNKPEEPTDTPTAQQEIDWAGEVQVATLDQEDWESFVAIFPNNDHVYGHMPDEEQHDARLWNFDVWRFRNKPAEPLRIRGWATIYKSVQDDGRIYYQFGEIWKTREEAEGCETRDVRVAIVYVDVYEGHGLEE